MLIVSQIFFLTIATAIFMLYLLAISEVWSISGKSAWKKYIYIYICLSYLPWHFVWLILQDWKNLWKALQNSKPEPSWSLQYFWERKGRVTGVGQSFGWTPGKRQSPSYVFCFSLNLVSLVLTIVVNRICLWIIPMLTLLHQKKLNTIIFVFKSSMTPMVVFHATLGKPRAHVFWVEGLYEAGFLKQQKFPLSVVKGW